MVSTRRKSYQPSPDVAAAPSPAAAARARHSSLCDPPAAASPRRSRRASSLTPLGSAGSAEESGPARGHRTKVLLEKYRGEAASKLKPVEEETTTLSKPEKQGGGSNEKRKETAATLCVPGEAATAETDAAELAMEVDGEDEVVDVERVDAAESSAEEREAARRVAAAQRVLAAVGAAARPAPVNAPAAAPAAPVPALTRVRPAPAPRGLAKSGRFWKSVRTPASRVVVKDPVSYEVRMQKRQRERVVKELENQLKNERKQKLEDLRKRREYNAKKAAENALKAEVYQVVKNPNKIKRMKKKQLRLLQKRDTTVVGKSVLDE
ncbi:Coiled-coil domain-containing protein 86 [Amphibalanus amphitrite]|uniref:Coiled-coil domain-containing protein 86 n=1 Tax=Amphibalanus amphitrite TaxID=1232801 RepID=A0A6A4WGW5_AMPAM|nr:Coiled-coil domain-containing protein 86 [Amphibalanus amphitrite]